MNIDYIGEHLVPGVLGRSFVWLGFLAATVSLVFYWLAFYGDQRRSFYQKAARTVYLIHSLSLVIVAGILYYLIFNHYFEYSYVWQYSSKELPLKYIISCFWAGQEGSFLFWALSQAIIGLILILVSRNWETPLMITFSLSQVFVTSMLLGIHIAGIPVGSSPFNLLRETVGSVRDTIFADPGYLTMITDGNGLNPLLENVWMTIHPPVLFIGYALTLVPFCYAIASFLKKEYHTWISRAFPWTVLAILVLGAGILLGGAWAYVSLTFGGFWAWDPVENSSLVPWLTLVAGLHFMLISRRQNLGAFAAYLFLSLSYVLVLYASFLTRSGILSETSAHSFGDSGMSVQLTVYMLTFLFILLFMVIRYFRQYHVPRNDVLLSREFWMFIGALVIVLAGFQIIFTTSIPVFNNLFGNDIAPPPDAIGFYNRWQTPFSLLIAAFIAFTQFMYYGTNSPGTFLRRSLWPLVIALMLTLPLAISGIVHHMNYILLVFSVFFAISASVINLILHTSKPKNLPAIVSHIGILIFILGVVMTFSNSQVISSFTAPANQVPAGNSAENIILMRGDTIPISRYHVVYSGRKSEGNTTHYQVDFLERTGMGFRKAFTLHPSVNIHPKMGAVYNPDTKHFPGRDFYTYIATFSREPDYIVIRAIMNPYINVLWLGSIVMLGGLVLSFIRRSRGRMRLRA